MKRHEIGLVAKSVLCPRQCMVKLLGPTNWMLVELSVRLYTISTIGDNI